ncbi:MAG: RNA polymerase sigma factor [Sphingobacteriia bacterium]|nr:RNA polymerase sigma factor [Sphingobacteriia bacterium]
MQSSESTTSSVEDLQIVDGCLEGNRNSQESLYKKYSRKMFAICLRYAKNQETAEDILQDGFIRVFGALNTFRKQGSLEGWIRRIMVNTALEYHRKEVKMYTISEAAEVSSESSDADALSQLSNIEALELLKSLPLGYRNVFNLYAIEGYNHAEIAEMLQISEGTSKSQLSRARSLLQQKVIQLNQISKEYVG